jgi:hypothetical protein
MKHWERAASRPQDFPSNETAAKFILNAPISAIPAGETPNVIYFFAFCPEG